MSVDTKELRSFHGWAARTDSERLDMLRAAADCIESQAAEIERLQRIIDSRPAINAGLVEAYVKWTSSIYAMDIMNATETKQ